MVVFTASGSFLLEAIYCVGKMYHFDNYLKATLNILWKRSHENSKYLVRGDYQNSVFAKKKTQDFGIFSASIFYKSIAGRYRPSG